MTKTLIIYHANCPDGFCAAWVAKKKFKDAIFYEGIYGQLPPLEIAEGSDVYILDFSYPRKQLEELAAISKSLTVLDHHKTAQADLIGMPNCIFDMNRSGAGITWDYFFPNEPRPNIVNYVEDRDLWKFQLPNSQEIGAFIKALPYDFDAWDSFASTDINDILQYAVGANIKLQSYIRAVLKEAREVTIDNWNGAIINIAYESASDVLNAILENNKNIDVAVSWFITKDGTISASVRSKTGVDSSGFSVSFGGGGHAQASGFKIKKNVDLWAERFRNSPKINNFTFEEKQLEKALEQWLV